jgi:hypothetical protein
MKLNIKNTFTLSKIEGNKDIKIADIFGKIKFPEATVESFKPAEYFSPEQVSYAKYGDSNKSLQILQKSNIVNPKSDLPKTKYFITKELNSIYYILHAFAGIQVGDIFVKKVGSFFDPTNNFFVITSIQKITNSLTNIAISTKYKGKLDAANDSVIVIRNGTAIYGLNSTETISQSSTKNKFPLNFVSDDGGKVQKYYHNLINSHFTGSKTTYSFADTYSSTESQVSTDLSTFTLNRI